MQLKTCRLVLMLGIFLFQNVYALPDWDIYTGNEVVNQDYGQIRVYNDTTLSMDAYSVDYMYAYNTSYINVGGIASVGSINLLGSSNLKIDNGSIGWICTNESSTANIYSGYGPGVRAYDTSTVTVYGGDWTDIGASGNATANIHGHDGSFFRLTVEALAVANIYGYDFSYSSAWLLGKWANGDPLQIYMRTPETIEQVVLNIVPEPTGICLLSLGAVFIRKRLY